MKRIKVSILFLLLILSSELFSQGGIWSIYLFGKNETPWTWVTFIAVIISFILLFTITSITAVFWKSGTIGRLLKKGNTDSAWEVKKLESNAKKTFLNIQYAIKNNNLFSINQIVTPELYDQLCSEANKRLEDTEAKKIKRVDVDIVELIGIEDFKINSNDRYSAYIEGIVTYFETNNCNKKRTGKKEKLKEEFAHIYQFVRVNNEWELETISNSVKLKDVYKSKIWVEK